MQEAQNQMCGSKSTPKVLRGINTIFNHFRNTHARYDIRGDIELFYTLETVVSTINVTLSIFLLVIYLDIYSKTRSEFAIGLTIFSAVFLLNALASTP